MRAARESFADVIVRVAFERQRDALGEERAEALTGRAGELEAEWCRPADPPSRSAARSRR